MRMMPDANGPPYSSAANAREKTKSSRAHAAHRGRAVAGPRPPLGPDPGIAHPGQANVTGFTAGAHSAQKVAASVAST